MGERRGCDTVPENAGSITPRGQSVLDVLAGLLDTERRAALANRARVDAHHILVVNLVSAPGAGKTVLLEATIHALRREMRMAVIAADPEGESDAERIRAYGVPAVQVCTGAACHLDADMVAEALERLDLAALDLIFIENVGNLVSPAGFDIGQHCDVALLSVPEGDDKPAKYPVLFRAANLVVLSKLDLAPLMPEFAASRAAANVGRSGGKARIIGLSALTGEGMAAWLDWLRGNLAARRPMRHITL